MCTKPANSIIQIHVESRKCAARGFQVLERLLAQNISQLLHILHRGCSLQSAPLAALSCAAGCLLRTNMEGATSNHAKGISTCATNHHMHGMPHPSCHRQCHGNITHFDLITTTAQGNIAFSPMSENASYLYVHGLPILILESQTLEYTVRACNVMHTNIHDGLCLVSTYKYIANGYLNLRYNN